MSQVLANSSGLRPSWGWALSRSVWVALGVLALALVMQLVIAPAAPGQVRMLSTMGIFVMLAVSLNIVNGFTGQFSMGHAAFMAVGAYVAGPVSYYLGLSWFGTAAAQGGLFSAGHWIMLGGSIAGAFVAAGFGYIVGLPSLRLRGDYLAIVTLGFGEIMRVLLQQSGPQVRDAEAWAKSGAAELWSIPLGGAEGFNNVPQYADLFWVYVLAGLTIVAAYRLKQSAAGRAFLSIREDEIAARAMGVNLTVYKVRAFVLAAFFAGLAGGLWAHSGVPLNPSQAGFTLSFEIVIMVVLGGMGSISGVVLAACGLTVMSEFLRSQNPPSVIGSVAEWAGNIGAPGEWPWLLIVLIVGAGVATLGARRWWTPWLVLACVLAGWEALRFAAVSAGIKLGDYRLVVYALLLIVTMIARPQGLMGVREVWEVIARRRSGAGAGAGAAAGATPSAKGGGA